MPKLNRRDFGRVATAGYALQAARPAASAPDDENLCKLTIAEASQLIRSRQTTATALVGSCIRRSQLYNPKLNAYITLMIEEATAQATALDAEARAGKFRGPLHGIPIALKDNIDTAGVRTTGGSAVFEDRFPDADAEVVRRLKEAGAVILAKANLQEFAMGSTSASTYFLPVRNPWALDRVPAGSSGGSGAAVIADMCIAALGTDTGGSIRMPAAFCSMVGLKPTYGLVSIRGIIPRTYSLDHCGPMTKTTEDAAILMNVLAGYDRLDVASVERTPDDYLAAMRQPVSGLRLGICRAPFFDRLDPEVAKATEDAIGVLKGLMKSTKDTHLPGTGTFSRAHLDGEILAVHADLYRRNANRYSLAQRRMIEGALKNLNESTGATCSNKMLEYIQSSWELTRLRRTVDDAFSQVDVMVLPTMRVLPPTINEALKSEEEPTPREPDAFSNCPPFNTFGIPAISIPCGFSKSGLPISLMVAGPRFSEGRVLAVARAFEQATEWHKRRPALRPDMPVPPIVRKG